VLDQELPLDAALQTWRDDVPLRVLPSGPAPPNPTEVLGSAQCSAILKALTDTADVVIVDAPALLAATDAAILTGMTSGLLLVTRVGSRAAHNEAALQSLSAVDQPVVGVILNRPDGGRRVPRRRTSDDRSDVKERLPANAPLHTAGAKQD
jgi:non-specific protein-tyrosine kinase